MQNSEVGTYCIVHGNDYDRHRRGGVTCANCTRSHSTALNSINMGISKRMVFRSQQKTCIPWVVVNSFLCAIPPLLLLLSIKSKGLGSIFTGISAAFKYSYRKFMLWKMWCFALQSNIIGRTNIPCTQHGMLKRN